MTSDPAPWRVPLKASLLTRSFSVDPPELCVCTTLYALSVPPRPVVHLGHPVCVDVPSETEAVLGREMKLTCIACLIREEIKAITTVDWFYFNNDTLPIPVELPSLPGCPPQTVLFFTFHRILNGWTLRWLQWKSCLHVWTKVTNLQSAILNM